MHVHETVKNARTTTAILKECDAHIEYWATCTDSIKMELRNLGRRFELKYMWFSENGDMRLTLTYIIARKAYELNKLVLPSELHVRTEYFDSDKDQIHIFRDNMLHIHTDLQKEIVYRLIGDATDTIVE